MRVFAAMTKAARISAELARYQGLRAAVTLPKAVAARVLWGVEPESFLMLGMDRRPVQFWRDWTYYGELEPGLRTINWRGDGRRLTVDKLATAERLLAAGIASPRILAVVGRDSQTHPHQGCFPALLRAEEVVIAIPGWPDRLIVKPADGWRGEGIFGAERSGVLWLVEDKALSDVQLATLLLARGCGAGLIVQERLFSHPALEPIGGKLGLGTVRVNTALMTDAVEVVFAFAKIMGSKCLVDNFSGGKFGNMLGQVDTAEGYLKRVYGRLPGQQFLMDEVDQHPLTSTIFAQFRLPLWPQVVETAKAVARAFPDAPLIGSDVAITPGGPVVIEVQSDWDANAAQLLMGRGLRPVLRDWLSRLNIAEPVRREAVAKLGLDGSRRRLRAKRCREDRALS